MSNVIRELQLRVHGADLSALTYDDVTAAATLLSIDARELLGEHVQAVDLATFAAIAFTPAGASRALLAGVFGAYYTGDSIRINVGGHAFKLIATARPDTLTHLAQIENKLPGGVQLLRKLVLGANAGVLAAATIAGITLSVKAPRTSRALAIVGAVHAARRTIRHRSARRRSQEILAHARTSGWWDEWLLGRQTSQAFADQLIG